MSQNKPSLTPEELIHVASSVCASDILNKILIERMTLLQLDYGQFIISLEGNGSDNCYEAFDVIPRAGYRKTDVRLSVIAPDTLDYDEGSCNDIIVKVRRRRDFLSVFLGYLMEPRRKLPEDTELPRGI